MGVDGAVEDFFGVESVPLGRVEDACNGVGVALDVMAGGLGLNIGPVFVGARDGDEASPVIDIDCEVSLLSKTAVFVTEDLLLCGREFPIEDWLRQVGGGGVVGGVKRPRFSAAPIRVAALG